MLAALKIKVSSYDNSELTNVVVNLHKSPELVTGSKTTSRYEISSNNFGCMFWVTDGAFKQIMENAANKKILETLQPGDTLNVKIQTTDKAFLTASYSSVRLIGLSKDGKELINPTETSRKENNTFYWILYIGIGLFSTGLVAKFSK